MNRTKTAVVLVLAAAFALPTLAQRKRTSPHETISAEVDGVKISIVYGRPYTKDPRSGEPRQIWGKLVPYGKVWRTGADEATLLISDKDLAFGDTTIPKGTNSLFTLPVEDGVSKLIVNKKTGQWGIPYREEAEKANELARIDMKKGTLDKPVDQFTMAIEKSASGGAVLKLMWEKTEFSVPFTVKK